jgi:hypothetical protein
VLMRSKNLYKLIFFLASETNIHDINKYSRYHHPTLFLHQY